MIKFVSKFCLFALPVFFLIYCQPSKTNQENQQASMEKDILNESQEAFDRRMEWWREATFGMFIHWGPYAVLAGEYKGEEVEGIGEWIMDRASIPVEEYEQYARQFNPVQFDADRWVQLAQQAGMKYIVITSKHHDGFALWNSKVSEYDVMDFAPIQRDLLGELKAACDKYDVKLCFYHSIMDWHHPDAQAPHYPDYNTSEKSNPNFDHYVENYLKPQVTELVENYNPHVLWFDGEWIPEWTHEDGVEMYTYLRSLNPDLVINNRVDKGRQGMQGMNAEGEFVGDFGTPEQEILEGTSNFDWESCMTMNDTWGYKKNDHNWKSTEVLVHNLVDVAAKGGNYLLNIGPTAEGLMPEPSVERLRQIGEWMGINSEAIYATEKLEHNYKQDENIRYTRKKEESVYYGISLEAPGNMVNFKYLKPKEGSEIHLLGFDIPLEWNFDEAQRLTISIPDEVAQNENLKYAWVFKVEGVEIQ